MKPLASEAVSYGIQLVSSCLITAPLFPRKDVRFIE